MSDVFPNLRVFVLTVGESSTIEVIRALKEKIGQPFELTAWYDTCGREFDKHFYSQLMAYTDDVIVLSKNHGTTGALAWAMLYSDYDYLLYVPADCVVTERFLQRLKFAFTQFENVACAGSLRVDNYPDYKSEFDFHINDKYFMPDGIMLISRKAVDGVGGIAACFKGMGMEQREWLERAVASGFSVVAVSKVMNEVGSTHDGRKLNPNVATEIAESSKTYCKILDIGIGKTAWWKKTVNRKEPALK